MYLDEAITAIRRAFMHDGEVLSATRPTEDWDAHGLIWDDGLIAYRTDNRGFVRLMDAPSAVLCEADTAADDWEVSALCGRRAAA